MSCLSISVILFGIAAMQASKEWGDFHSAVNVSSTVVASISGIHGGHSSTKVKTELSFGLQVTFA